MPVQSVYQPGKPGIPEKPMEFYDTHGKPTEFVNCTWIHMQNLSIHT